MSTAPERQAATLPTRTLLALVAGVLLVHVLLLRSAPAQWGPATGPGTVTPTRPFITRTIEIKPAASPAPAPVRPPPVRRVARPSAPISQSNTPPSPVPQGQPAIDSVADANQGALPSDTPASAPPAPEAAPAPPAEPAAAETPPTPGAAVALSIPGSVRLKYAATGHAKGMDYNASAELEWLQDGQSYDAKMVVSALFLGSRSMSSSGRISADGLAPTRFADKARSERAAHFQEDKGKISFSANTPDAPWRQGAQDRVSVFLQLASLLAGDPTKYPVGSTVALYTAGPTDADTWTFTVEAEEKLALPMGEVSALKLTRKPQRDFDQTLEVWFAPAMGYLPVRNRITQSNGDFVDQQLRSAEKP
jgi:hypothetical protein